MANKPYYYCYIFLWHSKLLHFVFEYIQLLLMCPLHGIIDRARTISSLAMGVNFAVYVNQFIKVMWKLGSLMYLGNGEPSDT